VAVVTKDRLVLDLSCRLKDGKYFVVTDKWQKFTDLEVNKETLDKLSGVLCVCCVLCVVCCVLCVVCCALRVACCVLRVECVRERERERECCLIDTHWRLMMNFEALTKPQTLNPDPQTLNPKP